MLPRYRQEASVGRRSRAGDTWRGLWCRYGFFVAISLLLFSCSRSNSQVPVEGVSPGSSDLSGLSRREANVTCLAPPRPSSDLGSYTFTSKTLPAGVGGVIFMTQPPGVTGRHYLLDRAGRVLAYEVNASGNAQGAAVVVVDFSSELVSAFGGEMGALGMAFHPNYQGGDRFLYVFFNSAGSSVVRRYTLAVDGLSAHTPVTVFSFSTPYATHHVGGWIGFSPSIRENNGGHHLYIATGENGIDWNSQNPANCLGKILRISVQAGAPYYGIPADNPYAGLANRCQAIYALGFRNPWRASFDAVTGELWVGDVGGSVREEVDLVQRGGNYGWP
jgi:glucose/arabinose dehydrogenase